MTRILEVLGLSAALLYPYSTGIAGEFCFDSIANTVESELNKKMESTKLTYIVSSISNTGSSGTIHSTDKNTYVNIFDVSAHSNSGSGDQVWICNNLSVAVVPDTSGKCNIRIDSIKPKSGGKLCRSDGSILK